MKKAMTRVPLTVLGLALGAVCATPAGAQEVLPFPPAPSGSKAGLTMQDSTYKKRVEPKRLAEGAPNILIILMDDVGPATPSTYGGEVNTPTLDRVAKLGISFNRFHSTAMCWPARRSSPGGTTPGSATDRSRRSPTTSTASAGRSKVLGDRRGSAQGLRIQHRGLGQVAQRRRADHEQGTVRVLADRLRLRVLLRIPRRRGLAVRADPDAQHHTGHGAPEGYHLTDDIASDAITWLREQKAYAPDKPFFMYWAPGPRTAAPDHEGMGRPV